MIAGGLILITGLLCKETVGMDDIDELPGMGMKGKGTLPMKEQLPAVMKNKYFWIALILGALVLFVNGNAIGAQFYYCNVVLGNPMYMEMLMPAGMAPGIIAMFFMPYFSNKYSKRAFMSAGAILMIIGFSVVGLAGNNLPMVIAGTVIRSLGITPMFAGLYAFVADAADYGEWKFGIRSEGLMSASQSIGSKIGIGFGSACSAWILAISGYIQPAMDAAMDLGAGPSGDIAGGALPVIQQPESVVAAIRFDYGWLGAIVSIILLICVLMMDVEKYLPEIRKGLGKEE